MKESTGEKSEIVEEGSGKDFLDGESTVGVENENVEVTIEEAKNILESVKIEGVEAKPKKAGRPAKVKTDIPTPIESKSLTESDIQSVDSQTKDLYNEFNSFLEDKAKIKSDSGVKDLIPTGIDVLDAYLGGGFAIGTMSVIVGTPGSGKSMLAIQTMANAQIKYKGNVLVSYLDSEEATTTVRLSNLGVKYPKIKPYTDITIEKVFKFLEGICLFKEEKDIIETPSVLIWDSIANTLSQKERETEDINSVIGYKARALSLLIPKYVAKLAIYNICLIAVNQLRDLVQIGQFQPAKEMKFMTTGKDIPGGNTIKFNAFHLLELKVKSVTDPVKFGFDGFIAEINCVKNKLFPPNNKFQVVGNFVTGFSNLWTNFQFLVATKRLETGAWNWLTTFPTKKFRTKDLEVLYSTDQEFKLAFDENVKEAINVEIINKYNPPVE